MSYVVIEGVIGVGKTVLSRLLAERLHMRAIFEQFEENPFLSNFYSDRDRYAFQTEVFFLLNRYRQQQSAVKRALLTGDVVADYMFAKTRLFAGMNLAGDELDLFEQIYDALSRQTAWPDLIVFLQAPVDTLMARIYQRDRSFERSMERAYIDRLSEVYSDFFETYSAAPVLRAETEGLDLVSDSSAQQHTINVIMKVLATTAREV